MKDLNISRRTFVGTSATVLTMLLTACGGSAPSGDAGGGDTPADTYEVVLGGTVTDAGMYVDRMVIDFGDNTVSGLENDTFEVLMTSTVDYGEAKDQPYAYFDATAPLEVVKTETNGGVATVYFNQAQAPVLTWLAEGRNYPAILSFTINQTKDLTLTTKDGRDLAFTGTFTSAATSYKDLENAELAKFEDVQDEINYQLHKGTNDKLIVWFHGNGEGDFPVIPAGPGERVVGSFWAQGPGSALDLDWGRACGFVGLWPAVCCLWEQMEPTWPPPSWTRCPGTRRSCRLKSEGWLHT